MKKGSAFSKNLILAMQHLSQVYKTYINVVSDENMRKFLRMMLEQKDAMRRLVEENAEQLDEVSGPQELLEEHIKKIRGGKYEPDKFSSLAKAEFLSILLEYEETAENFYRTCLGGCRSRESEDLLQSLVDNAKKQVALLRDRYELEQLL